ncbi:hypothetical protein H112_04196 [Trichophyton rubrum D6]|uniref:Uncharacterized protein n=2 Tax=Trichophyton rubrum TaxID=5551 RepID=A0A178F2B8_TRIRU|nr:hypothetical protein H100_04201 [Trichophyton rubrum MR850]EZF42083.1 hypothetical protein H102_04190 [Trichophyton rubrum CBS 100081]EZF52738.1 hypothetical protein H103_04198 [Trichophyton rubrum CBS 288.86]EZF63339.1 hypothetical protein H104_04187 [Trichophyton rubrum CBS 289.86]EZF84651.1 hypothetical protein H110_04191 [Trichophyton rubrum MR1448]EZF95399.1 hypothetical protein H113_04229 [Trichophyton rubrum MR1459]EZG16710.1 hypothetical protein H107_04316 [Trichophyton rubrum CBS 
MSRCHYYVVDDDEDDDVQIVGINSLNPEAAPGPQLGEYRLDTPRSFYQGTSYLSQPFYTGLAAHEMLATSAAGLGGVAPLIPFPAAYQSSSGQPSAAESVSAGPFFPPAAQTGHIVDLSSVPASQAAPVSESSAASASGSGSSHSSASSASGQATRSEYELDPTSSQTQTAPAPVHATIHEQSPTGDTVGRSAWSGIAYGNILKVLIGPRNCDSTTNPDQFPPSFFSDLANTIVSSFPYEDFAYKHRCTVDEVNHALIAQVVAPLIQCHSIDKKQMADTANDIYNRWVPSDYQYHDAQHANSSSHTTPTKPDHSRFHETSAREMCPSPQLTREETLEYARVLLEGIADYAFDTDNYTQAQNNAVPQAQIVGTPKPILTSNIQAQSEVEFIKNEHIFTTPCPPHSQDKDTNLSRRPMKHAESPTSLKRISSSTSSSTHSALINPKRRYEDIADPESPSPQNQLSRNERENTPRPTKKAKTAFSNLLPSSKTCEKEGPFPLLKLQNSEKAKKPDIYPAKPHTYVPLTDETRIKRQRVTVDPFGKYKKVSPYLEPNRNYTNILLERGVPLEKHPRTKRPLTERDIETIKKGQKNFFKYAMKLQCEHMDRLGLPHPILKEHLIDEGEDEAPAPEDFYHWDDEGFDD